MKQKLLLKTMLLLCILVGGASNAWALTYKLTIDKSDFNTTSYAANNNEKTSYAVCTTDNKKTFQVKWTSYQVYQNSSAMQWQKSKGCIYNSTDLGTITSVTVTSTAGSYTTYYGTTAQPSSGTSGSGKGFFKTSVGSTTGTTSKVEVFFEVTETHTLTYSATNGSISGIVYNTSTAVSSGASIEEGGKVTLTATPASGYAFTGWSVSENGGTFSDASANPTTFTMGTANATVTANFEQSSTVANPSFTVSEGTYNEAQSVEINCPTDGATIYYTIDGNDPTTESAVYSSAIAVNATTTIKAFAVKDGMTNSGIASATYTLKCATPEITVPAGVFLDTKEVTMTSSDGASIYYTIDGSEPTSSSTAYDPSNKPSISATTTLKAIATKSGWSDSEVATETFTKIVPLTVAQANTAIAALSNYGTITEQYVSGIISQVDSYNSTYHSITYWISDDGTTTNQLEVYGGLKTGDNSDNFSSKDDLKVGDVVTVFGTLKKYNSTYEFDKDNYLVSLVRKPAPSFLLDIDEATLKAYTHETADVTLTTNTDGEISCESSNTDVATVALKSAGVYTITAQSEGSATITIRSAASANYQAAEATVAVTVNDTREDAGISFTNDEEEITWGDAFTGQALTNDNSVAVEWSSTDEDVATVNSTGVVTVLKAGTTDIKANFAGNATYKTAVASYTLTVNKAEAGLSFDETSFDIMLNDDSFVAPTLNNPNGLKVTYTSSNTNVAVVDEDTGELVYDETAEGTAMITATFKTNDWYKGGSANYTINIVDPTVKGSKYNPYTVAEVANLTETLNNVYITGYIVGCVNNNKCYKTTTSSLVNTNILLSDDPNKSIKEGEQISGTSGMVPVELPTSPAVLRSNWGFKDNNVLGYKVICKGTEQAYFGKRGMKSTSEISAVSVPATLNASGYASFASTYALDFSDDSQFSAWQITDITTSAITFSQIKGAVAAGTGVLLKGTASSSINIPVAASGTDISTTNKLVGITTATAIIADQYYGLSGNKFVKVNAGTVKAGKALLPASEIPTTARELKFVFEDETTAIRGIENGQLRMENSFFDLQGRKIAKPTKGLYIKNGKKVVLK